MEKKCVQLKATFIAHANQLMEKITPDMVDCNILDQYEGIMPRSGVVDMFNANQIAMRLLEAQSTCKLYGKVCKSFFLAARLRVQKVEAMKLFEAQEKLSETDDKGKVKRPTDTVKNAYVDMAEETQKAKDIRNSWETLSEFFEVSVFEYKEKISWLKLIAERDMSTGDNIEE